MIWLSLSVISSILSWPSKFSLTFCRRVTHLDLSPFHHPVMFSISNLSFSLPKDPFKLSAPPLAVSFSEQANSTPTWLIPSSTSSSAECSCSLVTSLVRLTDLLCYTSNATCSLTIFFATSSSAARASCFAFSALSRAISRSRLYVATVSAN